MVLRLGDQYVIRLSTLPFLRAPKRLLGSPLEWKEQNLCSRISQNLMVVVVVGSSAGSAYDPGPKVPAFSATSRANFKFWSNSSHLIGISRE